MSQTENSDQQDLFDAQIIPLRLAITAMRDSGYKNTAYALAELIDNSVQAQASIVEVICIEKRELVNKRERLRLCKIAVLDNGSGMDEQTLRKALQFGNGTRLDDRTGIGRFGMGLPNASISQASRVEVWSWGNGPDNAIWSFIDLNEIKTAGMEEVPKPEHVPVPDEWRGISDHIGQHGTLVVWPVLDFERLTWKRANRALLRTEEIVGRVYRRFIERGDVVIRLYAAEDGAGDVLTDREAVINDPLYLAPMDALGQPFNMRPMFEPKPVFDETYDIKYNGDSHQVKVRYSMATEDTIAESGSLDRGRTTYGKHAANNIGVSVIRADREIMLDQGWCIGYDPRERWWGAEVEFPPQLDEVFGVTNNKQAATHFSELASFGWEELAEEGEGLMDVVSRLREDGDPRSCLLELCDSIRRTLNQLRKDIQGQSAGGRSTRRTRHNDADDVTKVANKGWGKRAKEHPIEEDKSTPTEKDLNNIRIDLTENKKYSQTSADELVSLIRDADLKVVFLEQEFTNPDELFNVETKGSVTEITFNRGHPAFNDIFGTIATADENVQELSREDAINRLTRSINSSKIIFAAWGRYEREIGVERVEALRKVRRAWGQIAAQFLQTEDDPLLDLGEED